MYEVELLPKVEKWISKLPGNHQQVIYSLLLMLEKYGHQLRMPHVKKVADKVNELRDMDYGYRVYYTHKDGKVYIALLGGDKTSQEKDIKQAAKLAKKIHR